MQVFLTGGISHSSLIWNVLVRAYEWACAYADRIMNTLEQVRFVLPRLLELMPLCPRCWSSVCIRWA